MLKDDQIASLKEKLVQALDEARVSKVHLEEKLVQVSLLELASSKFEDEHRSERVSNVRLEEKLVKISLELASSKALEDENRSKRRVDFNEKLVQMSLELASSN